MFCKECGKEIEYNSIYCNYCGSRQSSTQNKECSIKTKDVC